MTQGSAYEEISRQILAENARVLERVDAVAVDELLQRVWAAPRVFLLGEGRSGLVGRMIAMRLMHLGRTVYVVGDATTPAIAPGDLLLALSASGETAVTCLLAEKGIAAGAELVAITANTESRLARAAALAVVLQTPAKGLRDRSSIQFGGSLFEQSALLLGDALVVLAMHTAGERAAEMAARHTNLE